MKISHSKFNQQSDSFARLGGRLSAIGMLLVLIMHGSLAIAAQVSLKSVEFASLPGDKLRFQLRFDGPAIEPKIFSTDNPARIAMDFVAVKNGLKKRTIPVNVGVASGIHVVQASGRTRVVLNLINMVPFETKVEANNVFVTLRNEGSGPTKISSRANTPTVLSKVLPKQTIQDIDFRRGAGGEGQILVSFTDPNTVVDMQERGNKVVLRFLNTGLPDRLVKSLDVMDFATPVRRIETRRDGRRTTMTITPVSADHEYSSFQTEGLLTVEFRPLTRFEKEAAKKKKFKFTGQRLSLNFQDIEVRSVLQILADFTNLNIVASDTVEGSITLRLNDVPWDQAMDIILKSKGLAKRQTGNVILVAPTPEINKLEREELEALAVKEKLAPLKTEIIQIKYAKAEDIQAVLRGVQSKEAASDDVTLGDLQPRSQETLSFSDSGLGDSNFGSSNHDSILSARGVVNIDVRTNVLIVKDTALNLDAIRQLVNELDKPIRQVLIESRVVIASDDFTRALGVKLGAQRENQDPAVGGYSVGGGLLGPENLITNLALSGGTVATGGLSLMLFKASEFLLSLELTANQQEGKATVISNPRLITTDQHTAKIESGVEIPFETQSGLGGTNTQFKKAVLKLEVTPHITPDDMVLMDVLVKKDAPGELTGGDLAIDKREIETSVQVASGETVVLGGVYEGSTRDDVDSVPFFGELPGLGWLFRRTNVENKKNELLIFITPKILKESLKAL